MIYNDHKKFTTALLTLNHKNMSDWIRNNAVVSYDEIIKKIKVELLMFENQMEFKGKFPKKWIPSNFQIVEEEFSEGNLMINSTLKMVRHKITSSYHDRLECMYLPDAQKISLEENIKVLSKLFVLE